MHTFIYKNKQLSVEGLALEKVVENVNTPCYCYSAAALRNNYLAYQQHFDTAQICYALKANSNQNIIKILAELGSGADVVSEGELRRALAAGIAAEKIVYSGVAKTANEMKFALEQDIFQFNIESGAELEQLSKIATAMGKVAAIAFRINPDIDAQTHAKISTGNATNKFGIPLSRAKQAYAKAARLPGIKVQGIDIHIGSQLTRLAPFQLAFECIARLTTELRQQGHTISVLDIGGGLGINYNQTDPPAPKLVDYANLVKTTLDPLGCQIILEPGRSMVANTGVLLAEVVYIKQGVKDNFLIIDAGMNDLLRPSMYDAYHEILPLSQNDRPDCDYHIVGPICETSDTFSRSRQLPALQAGEYIAIMDTGAYGAVMASGYNTRPLVAEVLIEEGQQRIIRQRPSYAEIINLDC